MRRRDLRVPIRETVEAMAERGQQGKVRHLGLSEVTAGELREASDVHPIAAVQSEGPIWTAMWGATSYPRPPSLASALCPARRFAGHAQGAPDRRNLGALTLQHTAAQLDKLDAAAGAVAGARSADPVRRPGLGVRGQRIAGP